MFAFVIFVVAAIGFPLIIIKIISKGHNISVSVWRQVAAVAVFEVSFAPYALWLFLSNALNALINILQFSGVWLVWCVLRLRFGPRLSVLYVVVLGLVLFEPATTWLPVNGRTIDLSRGGDEVLDALHVAYRLAVAIMPLIVFGSLMSGKSNARAE